MKYRGVVVALVAGAVGMLAWSRCSSGSSDDTPAAASSAEGARGGGLHAAPAAPTLPGRVVGDGTQLALQPRGGVTTFDVSAHHTADPCTAVRAPEIPRGYESITSNGVTVAWSPVEGPPGPYDAPLRPASVAALAGGILDEAAQLLGTERRGEITIVIDSTRDDYLAKTRAPAWTSGYYDGGGIRMYAMPSEDVGVVLATLRHELMHAQLHVSVGCMPSWFNEGLAMYFAGAAPVHEWLEMMRERDLFDVARLADPAYDEMHTERANRTYAQSLAMIVYIAEHGGDGALREAAQRVRSLSRHEALELWARLYPGVGSRAVLETLALKVFAMPFGEALDRVLAGPLCCYGMRVVSDFGCRAGTPPTPTKQVWSDRSGSPAAVCNVRW